MLINLKLPLYSWNKQTTVMVHMLNHTIIWNDCTHWYTMDTAGKIGAPTGCSSTNYIKGIPKLSEVLISPRFLSCGYDVLFTNLLEMIHMSCHYPVSCASFFLVRVITDWSYQHFDERCFHLGSCILLSNHNCGIHKHQMILMSISSSQIQNVYCSLANIVECMKRNELKIFALPFTVHAQLRLFRC